MIKYDTSYCPTCSLKISELSSEVYIKEELPSVINEEMGTVLPRKSSRGTEKDIRIPYQGLGGVISSTGTFIKESSILDLKDDANRIKLAFGGSYPIKETTYIDKTAIYLGLAHRHWGHFLTDIVQRCWYPLVKGLLSSNNERVERIQDDINIPDDYLFVFAGFGDNATDFNGNYAQFFQLLGIDLNRIVIVNEPTTFKNIIVPNVAIQPGEFIHSVFKNLFDIVCQSAMLKATGLEVVENIYFSRTHLKDPKEMGEKRIEKRMRGLGYTIMYPEELNLVEQIFYWQTAKKISCVNGTIPHNCVFATDKLTLYIFNKMERIVGYQFTMDIVQGVSPLYISAFKEPFNKYPISVSRGPFWITITDEVKNFFIKEIKDTTIKVNDNNLTLDWINYIRLCVLADLKYGLRGGKSKVKSILKKIGFN